MLIMFTDIEIDH